MSRSDQLARQWKLLQELISARRGRAVSDLADALGCHPRTVYRDLEALQEAGFPLYAKTINGCRFWNMLETARKPVPIPFDLMELVALYFSRDMLTGLKDTVYFEALDSLCQKIKATLPDDQRHYLQRFAERFEVSTRAVKPYGHHARVIQQVNTALLQQCCLKLRYYSMSRKQETRRTVAPYRIWYHDGTFYLVGYCLKRRAIRIFALERVREVEETARRFEPARNVDIDAVLKRSFGVFQGEPQIVRIWFDAAVSEYIQERIWHPSQKIEPQKDGSIIFEANVAGIEEIRFWVLRWGAKARVLSPRNLVRKIRREAAAMAALYSASSETKSHQGATNKTPAA